MIHVASRLKTIHQPEKPCPNLGKDIQAIGFHFDLKPANILVKDSGILKISDFGQALFKYASIEGSTMGVHRGGSLVYQPPETSMVSHTTGFPELPLQSRRYDVWSLGCIMFEVLCYVLAGADDRDQGRHAVEQFEHARKREPTGDTYYTSTRQQAKLKRCVATELIKFSEQDDDYCADAAYLRGLVILLQEMFNTDRELRPTSSDVHASMEHLLTQLPSVKHSAEYVLSLSRNHPLSKDFGEVGWNDRGWDNMSGDGALERKSFLHI